MFQCLHALCRYYKSGSIQSEGASSDPAGSRGVVGGLRVDYTESRYHVGEVYTAKTQTATEAAFKSKVSAMCV